MKKNFLLVVVLLLTTSTFAQDKAIRQNSFMDNWYLQLQGGGSLTFSEDHKKASLGDLISPHFALSAGKYFSPAVSARLQLGGWKSNNYNAAAKDTYSRDYLQVNVDGMLNLMNTFTPYTHDKFFNIYALLGVGYVHGFKNDDMNMGRTNSIVPRAGFMFDFRVNDRVNLNLETVGNLMADNFNGIVGGKKYDGTFNVLAGVTYKLGKRSFDVVDVVDPTEINKLVNEIRAQQATLSERNATISQKNNQITDLQAQLASRPNVVVEESVNEEVVMNAVVVFKLGSSQLQDNQEINIYNAARFFQENPDMDIVITGYADKSTGSAAVNQRISEQRAEAVKKIMVSKFNINAARITTQGSGDKVQPFDNDAWNRVAIFTAVPKKR